MTTATLGVLRVLLEDPTQGHYGLEICEKAGLHSGTVYPLLGRLEQCGWLVSMWEDRETAQALNRPPRRYYRFSETGAAEVREELAKRKTPGWRVGGFASGGEAWTS